MSVVVVVVVVVIHDSDVQKALLACSLINYDACDVNERFVVVSFFCTNEELKNTRVLVSSIIL